MPLSEAELEEVYLRNRVQLTQVISRRVGPHDAPDLAQDLFLRLNRLAGKLPNASEARLYLLRMAHNIGKDHIRLNQNRARLLEGVALLFEDSPEPKAEDVVAARQEVHKLERAMAELTERQRDVLRRSRILGQPYTEIARAWGVSLRTVELDMAAALKHTRARVRNDQPPSIV